MLLDLSLMKSKLNFKTCVTLCMFVTVSLSGITEISREEPGPAGPAGPGSAAAPGRQQQGELPVCRG